MHYLPNMRPEMRYGIPAADQIVFNRQYSLGYSYYFRQAKWALEIVDKENTNLLSQQQTVDRLNTFRSDYRIPQMFRADKADYENSGYDRGHLVCSADKRENELENSETFLLSNMSPQTPTLNRQKWRLLEESIREYDQRKEIFQTHVICGPIFYFDQPVKVIGAKDSNGVSIPIPHAFFKSVLSEDNKGTLRIWSFILPNQEAPIAAELKEFLVATADVERYSGLFLWDELKGTKMDGEKAKVKPAGWLKGR